MQTSKCLIGKNMYYIKIQVLAIAGDTSTNFLTMFELERTAVDDKSSRVPLAAWEFFSTFAMPEKPANKYGSAFTQSSSENLTVFFRIRGFGQRSYSFVYQAVAASCSSGCVFIRRLHTYGCGVRPFILIRVLSEPSDEWMCRAPHFRTVCLTQ